MSREELRKIERRLFIKELLDAEVYTRLASVEKDRNLKRVLQRLANTESKHVSIWKKILDGGEPRQPALIKLMVYGYIISRKLVGVAFVSKLLSSNEHAALTEYSKLATKAGASKKDMEYIKKMIGEELATEKYISRSIKKYEKGVGYIRSMVLGLNDGLVEILAAVAGLAVLAETGIIVVITGVIIGISGTLSMAAGAYLSSKSHGLVASLLYSVSAACSLLLNNLDTKATPTNFLEMI